MNVKNNIDYYKLFDSLEYFKSNNFKYVDLDWIVDEYVSNITKPSDRKNFYINDKVLVASAEQSFLELIINNKLEYGRYCGITPCFRDEIVDYLHNNFFMKVELIDTMNTTIKSLNEIIDICLNNFNKYLPCEILQIDDITFDIIDSKNKIELGSYGIRMYNNFSWIYATGLAEPRLTNVIKLLK